MAQTYIEYCFSISPKTPWEDILLAELQILPFESFMSTKKGLNAYVPIKCHNENFLKSVKLLNRNEIEIKVTSSEIMPQNWNEKWESNFNPIYIGDDCVIRSDFHENQGKIYELIINPKMSFGTGHHSTTLMMLEFVLETLLEGKIILDMGCGTGVLGILAEKKGGVIASAIGGYDGHRGYIYYLAVLPEFQKKGVGSEILKKIEKKLLNKGCPKINLFVRNTNL